MFSLRDLRFVLCSRDLDVDSLAVSNLAFYRLIRNPFFMASFPATKFVLFTHDAPF